MKYKAIHFHLDYVEKYNRVLVGLEKDQKYNLTLGEAEKRRNHHEAKVAVLLHAGIKNGDGGRGHYERTEEHKMPWYEKVTAAKNAKRVAMGLEPYRPIGKAKKPRKR